MFLSNFLSNLTLSRGNAFIWDSKIKNLKIISYFSCLDLDLLIGIERQKKTIYDNTINFAEGNFTNNVLSSKPLHNPHKQHPEDYSHSGGVRDATSDR